MFHFIQTAKDDLRKTASKSVRVAGKGLKFLGNAAEDTGKAVVKLADSNFNPVTAVNKNVVAPAIHHVGALASSGSDIVKGAVDSATGNKEAVKNINKKKAKDFADALNAPSRVIAQAAETIRHPLSSHTVTPKSASDKIIFGDKPIQNIQAGVKSNYQEHKNLSTPARLALALGYGTGQAAQDLVTVYGGKKLADEAVQSGGKAIDKTVKEFDKQATNVANKHPAVKKIDEHINELTQHRTQLIDSNASHEAISASDKALKSAMSARDNTIKSIKEGGFIGSGDMKEKTIGALTGGGSFTSQQLDDLEAAGGSSAAKSIDRFKSAVTTPTQPGFQEPKTGAQVLNESLPGKVRLTPEVTQLLQDTGKAVPKASRTPILEGFRDPQSVASRYLGKTGSDIVYESSQAAKKRSDIQDAANPLIAEAEKNAKKLSRTTAGQPEVRRRLNQALEDRANADSYLKTPQEKAAYKSLQDAYDFGKKLLEKHGIGTLENYSPRIARRDAQSASEGLDYTLNKAFSNKTESSFTKKRASQEPTQSLTEDPVGALRGYFSSISKQLAYEPLMKSLPGRLQGVNPIHTINAADKELGKTYLQKHFKNLLQPDIPTGGFFGEKFQNKLINQTYRSALKFKPSFILTNPTQRLAARSQVSSEAIRLSKQIDPEDLKSLQEGLTSGKSTISSDLNSSASSLQGQQTKTDILHEKLSGEQGNVVRAFNLGVSQHIASSPIYKAAREAGKSSKEAAKKALADPTTRDAAIRDGNVLTNVTQFGANVANKPQVLAEGGTITGTPFSKKWYQQYKRFQFGTTQLLGNVISPKTSRALDIMRRGDPKQTQLVDYLKAAQTLRGAMKEARKTVNAGETKVTHADLNGAQEMLDRSIKVLNKQIKNASQIRGPRTAKNLGLMWAAASTIQFLFSGGTNAKQAIQYGTPVSPPSKTNNPLTLTAPSIPTSPYSKAPLGLSSKKLLNFIPVVGPTINRASEAQKLIKALTGSGK